MALKFRGIEWSDSEKRTLDDLNAGSLLVDINWPYPVLCPLPPLLKSWLAREWLHPQSSPCSEQKIPGVLAMDWIGNIGYLYCLADQNGLYVAKSIDVLNIPTSVSGMTQFKNTLRLVFAYKHSILRTGLMTEHGLNERQYVDRLREVIDVSVVTPEPSTHHDIFFTPTNSRVKKVEITRE
ncbi:predicted protein [Lichtheimia corymbifera JMRC:FSU:9682]|uniref:Uncharacterized protein n=1 Tax=Lichtheimia corymbifera JMRC:FSU:9682 TaxID=1263082 RepID=A0A068RU93_9FUNG|nr:predicted protein [Lichtheimia corymbifera JMRC:FSU:9682]